MIRGISLSKNGDYLSGDPYFPLVPLLANDELPVDGRILIYISLLVLDSQGGIRIDQLHGGNNKYYRRKLIPF